MIRWLLLAMSVLAASSAFAERQPADAALTGRLARMETLHPGGETISGWVLLAYDTCVSIELMDGEMADIRPRVIHLVFAEGAEPGNLMALSVDEVTVRGDLVEAHTIWHLGDVVMFDTAIVRE